MYIFFDKLFCHHTLAVADKEGKLVDYLSCINSKPQCRSLNKLLHNQCIGAGKKKGACNRKGPNNTLAVPITTSVPLAVPPRSISLNPL